MLFVAFGRVVAVMAEPGGRKDGEGAEAVGPLCTTCSLEREATRKERYWPIEGM